MWAERDQAECDTLVAAHLLVDGGQPRCREPELPVAPMQAPVEPEAGGCSREQPEVDHAACAEGKGQRWPSRRVGSFEGRGAVANGRGSGVCGGIARARLEALTRLRLSERIGPECPLAQRQRDGDGGGPLELVAGRCPQHATARSPVFVERERQLQLAARGEDPPVDVAEAPPCQIVTQRSRARR
jgi:hypothetical protein